MTTLLDLSDDELAALSPAEVERLETAALTDLRTTRRLTPDQLSFLVESWNDLHPDERRARHARCVPKGRPIRHDWVRAPWDGTAVCRRCLTYKVIEE